jgi:hypothetical protein
VFADLVNVADLAAVDQANALELQVGLVYRQVNRRYLAG